MGLGRIKKYSENSTQNLTREDFTGSPVAKTLYFQCRGPGPALVRRQIQHAAVKTEDPMYCK